MQRSLLPSGGWIVVDFVRALCGMSEHRRRPRRSRIIMQPALPGTRWDGAGTAVMWAKFPPFGALNRCGRRRWRLEHIWAICGTRQSEHRCSSTANFVEISAPITERQV